MIYLMILYSKYGKFSNLEIKSFETSIFLFLDSISKLKFSPLFSEFIVKVSLQFPFESSTKTSLISLIKFSFISF